MGISASALLVLAIAAAPSSAPPSSASLLRNADGCDLARFGIRFVSALQSDTPPARGNDTDPCAPVAAPRTRRQSATTPAARRPARAQPPVLGTPSSVAVATPASGSVVTASGTPSSGSVVTAGVTPASGSVTTPNATTSSRSVVPAGGAPASGSVVTAGGTPSSGSVVTAGGTPSGGSTVTAGGTTTGGSVPASGTHITAAGASAAPGVPVGTGGTVVTPGTPSTGVVATAPGASSTGGVVTAPGASSTGVVVTAPGTSSAGGVVTAPGASSAGGVISAPGVPGPTVAGNVPGAQGSGALADTVPAADPRLARQNLARLRLRSLTVRDAVRPGPAGSITTPTALGLETGEVFAGIAYQQRTRFTQEDDAGAGIGIGLGSRRIIAAEAVLTTYSTIRGGGPLETGAVSLKLHRALPFESAIAVGVENAALWGNSDTERSYYGVVSHLFRRGSDPTARFNMALLSVGVGDGRFRTEDAIRNRREGFNVFASAGVRVTEPVSLIADWTGQDLNVAASFTPIRGQALVITPGLADVLGTAGDGARFIIAVGYGLSLRRAF